MKAVLVAGFTLSVFFLSLPLSAALPIKQRLISAQDTGQKVNPGGTKLNPGADQICGPEDEEQCSPGGTKLGPVENDLVDLDPENASDLDPERLNCELTDDYVNNCEASDDYVN